MTDRKILRNCGCVVGAGLEVRTGVDVVIEDGLISDIVPAAARDEGIDCTGMLVVPGLINAHTHLGDSVAAGRGFGVAPGELLWQPHGRRHHWMAEAGPDAVVEALHDAALTMLGAGTVAFADFREGGLDGVAQLHRAMDGLPITAVVFGRYHTFPVHPADELEANAAGLSEARLAEIDAVVKAAGGFSPLWANDTTDTGLRQTAERVRAHGGRLATHAGETDEYRTLSRQRTGAGDIERIIQHLSPDFVVHMTAGTPEEFRLLAEAGIPAVMCPRTQAVLGHGVPPMALALAQGVTVALGTDNAMLSQPDMLAEMSFFSRASRAVSRQVAEPTARQMLAATTTAAADALGLSDRLGHLDVGRPATLFLVDMGSPRLRHFTDPLVALVTDAGAGDVVATLVDGRLAAGSFPRGENRP